MNNTVIKEITSAAAAEYRHFMAAALQEDAENLLITPNDHAGAPFPTKDSIDSFTLGAYTDNRLAGVVSFTRDGADREKLRHKGFVFTMYVSKACRGRGTGRALLAALIERIKTVPGIEQVNLIVLSANTGARQLYEKFGFKQFATEVNSIKWEGRYFSEDYMVLRLKQ